MNDNPYGKLAEAARVYLNPSLQLIIQNVDLKEHCYFHLKKPPPAKSEFWNVIDQDWEKIIQVVEQETNLPDHEKLLHNLNLAQQKNDQSYLEFLKGQKPKKKMELNLFRKNAIIDLKFAPIFNLTDDEAKRLSTVQLKILIHQYIKEQKLQHEDLVTLDQTLQELLHLNDINQIHYFDLLQQYNQVFRNEIKTPN